MRRGVRPRLGPRSAFAVTTATEAAVADHATRWLAAGRDNVCGRARLAARADSARAQVLLFYPYSIVPETDTDLVCNY